MKRNFHSLWSLARVLPVFLSLGKQMCFATRPGGWQTRAVSDQQGRWILSMRSCCGASTESRVVEPLPMAHMPGLTQTQVGGVQGSPFPTSPWATISCQLAPWVSTMSQTWEWGEERWNKSRAGAASGVGSSCSARWEIHSSANWMGSLGSFFFFFLSDKHFFSTSSVVLTANREADQVVDGFSCDLRKTWFQVQ